MATGGRFLAIALVTSLTLVALPSALADDGHDLPVTPPDTTLPAPPVTVGRCIQILDDFGGAMNLNGARDVLVMAYEHQADEAAGFAEDTRDRVAPDPTSEQLVGLYVGTINTINYTMQNVSAMPLVFSENTRPAVDGALNGTAAILLATLTLGPDLLNQSVPWANETYREVSGPLFEFEEGTGAFDALDSAGRERLMTFPVAYTLHVLGAISPASSPTNEAMDGISYGTALAAAGVLTLAQAMLASTYATSDAIRGLASFDYPLVGDPEAALAHLQQSADTRTGSMTDLAQEDTASLVFVFLTGAGAVAGQAQGAPSRAVSCPDVHA